MYKNEKPIQKSLLAHNIIAHLKISTKATKRLSGFTREFSKFASCKGYLCLGKKKNPMPRLLRSIFFLCNHDKEKEICVGFAVAS